MMTILKRAMSAHQAGHFKKAEVLYLRCLEHSDDYGAMQLLGMVYSETRNPDLAIKYMADSLARQNNQPAVHNNIANCLKRQGRSAEALEHYRTAILLQPDYVDAYRNLALALQQQGEYLASEQYVLQGLSLDQEDAALYNLLGAIKKELNDYPGAIECYEKALEIRPGHAGTEHDLGVALRLNNQPGLALKRYQCLLDKKLESFELFQNVGNAYSDIAELETAIEFYRKALKLNPGYVDTHRNLSALLYSLGHEDQFVASYEQVFSQNIVNDELILSCAESLLAARRPEAAFQHLEKWQVAEPEHPDYLDFVGRCHMAAGNGTEAIHAHELACKIDPSMIHLHNFGATLLEAGAISHAAEVLEHVFTVEPANQSALSHLTLCWRILGDEREAKINNYEQLMSPYQLPTPEGFGSIDEFNQYLDKFLTRVHTTRHHPYEQSVRGGTQTHGNLLAWESEELRLLIKSLKICINEHLQRVALLEPPFPEFPKTEYFDFSASFSVKLKSHGFHTNHIHPMGWFSSAYYVTVPDAMDQGNKEGWLTFGEPNFTCPEPLPPQCHVEPEAGKLALFPSYMWHGTIPFQSDQTRTTVVFDIIPVHKRQGIPG
jgi:tetratricopeptide (TPR) repeat protein